MRVAQSSCSSLWDTASTGVLAPVNTPADIVQRLYREIAQVLARPDVVQAFADQGALVRLLGPAQFGAYLETELARWSQAGKRLGIRID